LGTTDVICTDKTGTLPENRMRPVMVWTESGRTDLRSAGDGGDVRVDDAALTALGRAVVGCNNAHREDGDSADPAWVGDPTEIGLMLTAQALGVPSDDEERDRNRIASTTSILRSS